MTTSILYLHGVGQKVRDGGWHAALTASLAERSVEVPPIDSPRIICPDYVDLLKVPAVKKVDEPTRRQPVDMDEMQRLRMVADHKRRQTLLTARLDSLAGNDLRWGIGAGIPAQRAPGVGDIVDAKRYLGSEPLRFAILQRVLSALGTTRDVVIVAHSLGSVVAIDLLNYLPPGIHVRGLVTLGSPAGAVGVHKADMGRLLRKFPYEQVDTWVNFLVPHDVVTRGIGLTRLFPAALDVRLASGDVNPVKAHAVTGYLAHPAVAHVLTQLVTDQLPVRATATGAGLELALDEHESQVADSIVFAHRIAKAITKGGKRVRYENAIREVAIETGSKLVDLRVAEGRPVPAEVGLLAGGEVAMRQLAVGSIKDQLRFVIVAATSNLIAPFEIDVQDESLRTLRFVWVNDFGHSRDDGSKIIEALDSASSAFKNAHWGRLAVGAAGLGLAALGPIGLALVAPAGLAGGAAIVGALAAFGPGGMVGGLALAGGMVGAGASLVGASAMASSEVTPDMLRTQLIRLMACEKAAAALDIELGGSSLWLMFNDWRDKALTNLSALEVLSDKDAPSIKDLQVKVKLLEQALAWLIEERFAPSLE